MLTNVKEMIPVVTMPIKRAKPILCFNSVFMIDNLFIGRKTQAFYFFICPISFFNTFAITVIALPLPETRFIIMAPSTIANIFVANSL